MAENYDPETPVDRRAETVLFIIMVVGLALSVIAMFMEHTNIAVAFAGIGGLAMVGMFTCLIGSTFLPLPDFPMDDNPRVRRGEDVEDSPTIH